METSQEAKEARSNPIKELLDKLAWQREAEGLYDAFIDALGTIGDRDIKSDCCLNTVKFMATQNASARAKNKDDDEEVAVLFEEECKRFSDDLLKMPSQFREWLKSADREEAKRREGSHAGIAILELILSSNGIVCNCVRCREFAKATEGPEGSEEAESPTEPPPPPPPAGQEAAP